MSGIGISAACEPVAPRVEASGQPVNTSTTGPCGEQSCTAARGPTQDITKRYWGDDLFTNFGLPQKL